MALKRNESGQAVFEYVLLLTILVSGYVLLVNGLKDSGMGKKMLAPIQEDYRRAYQYGNTTAKGYEDGAPENHPRVANGKKNFHLFLNPSRQ